MTEKSLLNTPVEHLDLSTFNPVPLVDAMQHMAFQARNTARAAQIYERMLQDKDCAVVLCLAGSLVSAGLRRVFVQMVEAGMVDAIVSTGANIVDQDFFEALGFRHWQGSSALNDESLREQAIDRIYDTLIDEDELRICDHTVFDIVEGMAPGAYSSREVLVEMGRWLVEQGKGEGSLVRTCYEKGVPIFCPAFSDCSAGFGLVMHRHKALAEGRETVAIDSGKDFHEITRLKLAVPDTGLFMLGGGVPKNFAQDIVVAAELLNEDVGMHKYAVQITVADERDGALSGSTLQEACSWGKVAITHEQMVYGEATVFTPLIAGYCWHKQAAAGRPERNFNSLLDTPATPAGSAT